MATLIVAVAAPFAGLLLLLVLAGVEAIVFGQKDALDPVAASEPEGLNADNESATELLETREHEQEAIGTFQPINIQDLPLVLSQAVATPRVGPPSVP
ncbi:MAG: hypothetical protein J2P57_11250 [Acidimicrobiaceae bacterium]|nr:hypothetical protein [Acidimicrobiaceae bacterium]